MYGALRTLFVDVYFSFEGNHDRSEETTNHVWRNDKKTSELFFQDGPPQPAKLHSIPWSSHSQSLVINQAFASRAPQTI